MAQVFKSIVFPARISVGGRKLIVATIEFGTEYLVKGVVVKPSDLGLTSIDAAIPCSEIMLAEEGTEGFAPSIVLIKPATTEAELKVQIFGSGAAKKEAAFELADKAGGASQGKLTLFVIGAGL